MKADYILVVMNGEIIERGTHQELIHAQGKYNNLWSKQIFVKPSSDRSRSRSPKKQDPDSEIINDLTPAHQKTELAKLMKTTPQSDPKLADGSKAGDARSSTTHKSEVREDTEDTDETK